MTRHERHDRTVRLLEARLEALARISECSLVGARPFDEAVLRAAAATRHAIALELLTPEEAGEIWAEVARRHPCAPWSKRSFNGLAGASMFQIQHAGELPCWT